MVETGGCLCVSTAGAEHALSLGNYDAFVCDQTRNVWGGCSGMERATAHFSRHYNARNGAPSIDLLEGFYGCGFVIFYVEHRVKLRDLEQIVDLLGQVQQL